MTLKISVTSAAVSVAMLIVAVNGLWSHMDKPYIGLFIGQFVFYAVASNVIVGRIIGNGWSALHRMKATETLILVFIAQLTLAWIAFGSFFYETRGHGFPDRYSLLLDGYLRNTLVIQQAAVIVWSVIARWSTKKFDRIVATILALIGLLLVLPNFR